MKYILIVACLLLLANEGFCQDSLKLDSEFNIELKGQHILSAIAQNPIECINCPFREVRDNPLHHFAIYTGINYKGTLAEKYSFEAGLYLEERSFSHGNNTLEKLVVFPKIKISALDSVKRKGGLFKYALAAGDFWDEDFNDILRIHNLDFQGIKTKFSWNEFSFGFYAIGDLSRNIGFSLHELYKFTFEYEKQRFDNIISLTINELYAAPFGNHPEPRDVNFANYFRFRFSENLIGISQIDIRSNELDKAAIAAGISIRYEKENLELTSGLRYYQAGFNRGYLSFQPRFRIGESYIGPQLYPLKNYYRPINQWALFTGFVGSDILNWEFRLNRDKTLYKKLHFTSEIDFNLVYDISLNRFSYYPLYNIGMSYKFLNNFVVSVTGTNKHMNLDTYYQTSYASKLPLLSYNFKMDLNELKTKPIYFKL
jgi:hypothetical protein